MTRKIYRITEASLSRIWQHITSHDKVKSWGLISAYRAANSKKDNISVNKKLEQDIRSLNLGFFKVEGHWRECQDPNISWKDCPPNKLKDATEETFFIPNIKKDSLLNLTKKYNQDAAVYGDNSDPNVAKLLFKNGEMDSLGKFNANKVQQGYSKLRKGSTFAFAESENFKESYKNHPVYEMIQRLLKNN